MVRSSASSSAAVVPFLSWARWSGDEDSSAYSSLSSAVGVVDGAATVSPLAATFRGAAP